MKSKKRHADRLSTLPYEMLQHILSHLTSEEAVQTSLLSHRWRDVYAGVPTVDLTDTKSGRNKQEQLVCFDQQVTGAILCKSPGTPISTFRLNAFNPPRDLLHQWILIAVSSGVEEIDVKLRYQHCSKRRLCPFGSSNKASADFDQHERKSYVKTQHHLFGCPTLRRLCLANWTLHLPLGGVAMSATLDTLCLARIMDPKDQLQQLLSSCPHLAHLTLQECPSLTDITVTSARLKSFAMICCHHARRVELSSHRLQLLQYKGGLLPHNSLFKLADHAGVVALKIEICQDLSDQEPTEFAPATELIKGCTKLAHLHLSLRPSMAHCSSFFFTDVLPCMQHLRQLGLQCCFRNDNDVRSVAVLLGETENLEVLSMFPLGPETPKEVDMWYWSDSESDTEPEDGGGDGVDYSSQVTDDFWPRHIRCLDDKLRRINIRNYRGLQLEKMLAKFLLSKAAALEEFSVTLTAGCSQNKSKIAKELRSWRLNHHTRVTVNRC
jgi:hypothetical protein